MWFLPSDVSVAEHVDLLIKARGLQGLRKTGEGGSSLRSGPMGKWVSKANLFRRKAQTLCKSSRGRAGTALWPVLLRSSRA